VWFFFGSSKPNLNSFLRPFVLSLRKIHSDGGVDWVDPATNENRKSMVRAPFSSMDAPARSQGLNMITHGGFFACGMCLVKGVSVPTIRGHKVVYPSVLDEPFVLRTAEQMREEALQATRAHAVNGLFGPSIISYIPRFDPARSVPNEFMHGCCLGVSKTFASVWLTDTRGDWYIKPSISWIDEFLAAILPPDTIKRVPRSVLLWLKWKASEWLFWLLFYSVPALLEFWTLENKFLQHWLLFVKAIHNLLLEEIEPYHIAEARTLLNLFLEEIRSLYRYRDPNQPAETPRNEWRWLSGDWMYTFNVHQIYHLPTVVEDTGGLWTTSAFDFEDNIEKLVNLIHGTNNIDKELRDNLQLLESIEVLRRKVAETHPEEGPEAGKARNHVLKVDLDGDEVQKLKLVVGDDQLTTADLCVYSRVTFNGKVHSSRSWERPEKRNSFTAKIKDSTGVFYGEMLYFITVGETGAS